MAGNRGCGTAAYRSYGRDFECRAGAKPPLPGSADPHFLGDATRWNPEDLLVASLAACHQLWYLHLCAEAGVVVEAYRDRAHGTLRTAPDGTVEFCEVTLCPEIVTAPGSSVERAHRLHAEASVSCFIARHDPRITVGDVAPAACDAPPLPHR